MSVQAMSFAIRQQFVSDASARHVLLVMANYANQDGSAAFASVGTMVRDTGLSERSIRSKIDHLEQIGIIRRGNQKVAAAYIDRQDRRPVVYDILLDFDGQHGSTPVNDGVQILHPATGCKSSSDGVQILQERGATVAPNPSLNPSIKPKSVTRELPNWIDREAWDGFVEMRKRLGKPLTSWAEELAIKKLEKFRAQGQDANAILDQSTLASWQGLFPVRDASLPIRQPTRVSTQQAKRDDWNAQLDRIREKVNGDQHANRDDGVIEVQATVVGA